MALHTVEFHSVRRVAATYIEVRADVRYWEDATVNGVDDEDGSRIPFRDGGAWCPLIRLDDGMIVDWPQGMTARIHYKVCDQGEYWLLDVNRARVAQWSGHYVPDAYLCHGADGYGDYIIFSVNADGTIVGWKAPRSEPGDWLPIDARGRREGRRVMKIDDTKPAVLSAVEIEEIRQWIVQAKQNPKGRGIQLVIDAERLLTHLDALAAGPVPDGEALGRAAWGARDRGLDPYPVPCTWEALPATWQAHWIAIGTALYLQGFAAGAVAVSGEGDDPAVEGAILILMKRRDREQREAHAAGRAEGTGSETIAHLIEARNTAQRTAEEAHATIARLQAELAAALEEVAISRREAQSACNGMDHLQDKIDALTAELAEARAAVERWKAACERQEQANASADREDDKRVAAARRDGAREEREAIRSAASRGCGRSLAGEGYAAFESIVDLCDARARGEGQGS